MGFLDVTCRKGFLNKSISHLEVEKEIKSLNNTKTPGYDVIETKTIKALSEKCTQYLPLLYNAILRLYHFQTQWKCAEIIMVLKPKNSENDIKSY